MIAKKQQEHQGKELGRIGNAGIKSLKKAFVLQWTKNG
jgi:hypothetical protein